MGGTVGSGGSAHAASGGAGALAGNAGASGAAGSSGNASVDGTGGGTGGFSSAAGAATSGGTAGGTAGVSGTSGAAGVTGTAGALGSGGIGGVVGAAGSDGGVDATADASGGASGDASADVSIDAVADASPDAPADDAGSLCYRLPDLDATVGCACTLDPSTMLLNTSVECFCARYGCPCDLDDALAIHQSCAPEDRVTVTRRDPPCGETIVEIVSGVPLIIGGIRFVFDAAGALVRVEPFTDVASATCPFDGAMSGIGLYAGVLTSCQTAMTTCVLCEGNVPNPSCG